MEGATLKADFGGVEQRFLFKINRRKSREVCKGVRKRSRVVLESWKTLMNCTELAWMRKVSSPTMPTKHDNSANIPFVQNAERHRKLFGPI